MKRIIKRFIRFLLLYIVFCCIYMASLVMPTVIEYYTYAKDVVASSDASDFHPGDSSFIYDNKGKIMAKLSDETDSAYLTYDKIPKEVVNSFIAIEDRTFWTNKGYDLKGIARVLVGFVKSNGDTKHGASTITQQLIKNVYLTSEVSLERKLKEIFIAYFITKKYSKEEIMEYYINNIYYGNSYYGIQAAAHGYFNKDVQDLSLGEITYLCAIPNNPSYYDPRVYPENPKKRRTDILDAMLELNMINQKQYDEANNKEVKFNKAKIHYNDFAVTYAIDCAVEWQMKEDGFKFKYTYANNKKYKKYVKKYNQAYQKARGELNHGGYHIYTAIDLKKQKKLQKVLNRELAFDKTKTKKVYNLQGAITAVDNTTGLVVAVIGGRTQKAVSSDYKLNRAFQSYRQPGSTIKPLVVYTPAIDNGFLTTSVLTNIDVVAARNRDATTMGGSGVNLRYALTNSMNGPAWWLFSKIRPETGISYLTDMHFKNVVPGDYNAATALGGMTYGATTVEMAGAYCALANHGLYRDVTCIHNIKDADKNVIYEGSDMRQVYSEKAADSITNVMQDVLRVGTAKQLAWSSSSNIDAACKTGTTNNSKDGWLCGFTPYYTVSVWVGYDTPKSLSTLYGATYPGQIWKKSMLTLTKGKKVKRFDLSHMNDKVADKTISSLKKDVVLSDGETVKEYNKKIKLTQKVDNAIINMKNTDRDLYNYYSIIENIYNETIKELNKSKNKKLAKQLKSKLDIEYNKLKNTTFNP